MTPSTRELSLQIDGMSCGGCVASVRSVLARITGLSVVSVDVGSARVTIEGDRASEDDVVRAIEKAGFTARGVSPA
jgi:copper chaperone CopZ